MRSIRLLSLVLVFVLPFGASAQRERLPREDLLIVEKEWPDAVRSYSGLRSKVLVPGSGARPKPGQVVSVLYTGRLLDGTVFDQNQDRDNPLVFRLGRNLVIDGWDEGLKLMQVGEKRLLIIPYELGYGTLGKPPSIPRRATLIFEVELLAILPDSAAAK